MKAKATKAKKKPRKPSAVDAKLKELLVWIAGGKTLMAFTKQRSSLSWSTIWRRLDEDEQFAADYARAREIGRHAIAEEMLTLADEPQVGVIRTVETNKEGDSTTKEQFRDNVERARLQLDTRKWLLSKWGPKDYGDKLDVQHTIPTITHTIDWANAPADKPPDRP